MKKRQQRPRPPKKRNKPYKPQQAKNGFDSFLEKVMGNSRVAQVMPATIANFGQESAEAAEYAEQMKKYCAQRINGFIAARVQDDYVRAWANRLHEATCNEDLANLARDLDNYASRYQY